MTTFDGDTSAGEAVDLTEANAFQDAAAPAEEVDPAAALKAELRSKPGDWYVVLLRRVREQGQGQPGNPGAEP